MKKDTLIILAVVAGTLGLLWYLWSRVKGAPPYVPPVVDGGGGTSPVDNSEQAAREAEAALLRAQQAAEAAAVQAAANAAAEAEAANAAAQIAASLAAADAIKAAAAAAAQAAANAAAAAFEASLAAQLSEVEASTNAAKQACDVALSAFNTAKANLVTQQNAFDAKMNDPSGVEVWENGSLQGKVNRYGVGSYSSFNNMPVGNDHASSLYIKQGFRFIGYRDGNFGGISQSWEAMNGNLTVNLAGTALGNDQMSSCVVQKCPAAFAAYLSTFQSIVDQVKLNLAACKVALNLCIERTQSVVDNIRTYNILSSRIYTVSSSLVALRTYVSKIPV